MAKLRGPLMSIAASGTIGGMVTFESRSGGPVARLKPSSTKPASYSQIQHRANVSVCAATWQTLSAPDKARWQAIAANLGLPVMAKFMHEWIAQNSTNTTPPYFTD